MEQPNKDKKKLALSVKVIDPDKVKFTDTELAQHKKVQKDNKTEAKAKVISEKSGMDLDTKTGTMNPRPYEKRLIKAKEGSGKQSMVVDGGGKVLSKAVPGTRQAEEQERNYKSDSTMTVNARKRNSELNEIQMDRGTNTKEFKKRIQKAEAEEKYNQKNYKK